MFALFCLMNGYSVLAVASLLNAMADITPDVKMAAQVMRDIDRSGFSEDQILSAITEFAMLMLEYMTKPVDPSLN